MVAPFLRDLYAQPWTSLSALNQYAIMTIAREFLGIRTTFRDSREFPLDGQKGDRLLDLLRQVGGHSMTTWYLNNPVLF